MIAKTVAAVVAACVAILAAIFSSQSIGKCMFGDPPTADFAIINAVIFTCDSEQPWAESMAVRGGRILSVGNFSSVKKHIHNGTKLLDLQGKMVLPGFIDSHLHFIDGGLQMRRVDLHKVNSKVEFILEVEKAANNIEKGQWILGGGWNDGIWGGELPDSSWIDNVTQHHPVWLVRMDGHMGLANSFALRKARIETVSHEILGGFIMKAKDGAPTGILVDAAMQLIEPYIPEPTIKERREAMLRASRLALSRGVTGVVDFGRYYPGHSTSNVWKDFADVYKWADTTGQMLLRAWLFFPMETWFQVAKLIRSSGRALSPRLHVGGVKAFADGSLGSNSALFYEPYADDQSNHGILVADLNWILENALKADKAGIQIAIHAIGDKANDMVLSIRKKLALLNGEQDRRFRIEHAQHLAAHSIDDFRTHKVIASMQPEHLLDDAHSAAKKLGEKRALEESYLFKSVILSNTCLAFGSDWPVADLNPLGGIKAATKRIPFNWDHPWIESECISIEDSVYSYTRSAAYAIFMENELGSLSKGKWADFVVLSKGLWDECDPSVAATYIGGVQAYP